MRKNKTEMVAITGITAAVYMVLTLFISPFAFGAVQFRISEAMVMLAWVNPSFIPGLVLGCALSNMFSPLGIIDVVFGTLHTFCSLMMMKRTKNMYAASLWPTLFSFIIGIELHWVYDLPIIMSTLSVMVGEIISVSVIGNVIFMMLRKNNRIMEILRKY